MTEAYYGTETAEPAAAPAQDAGDSPGYDEAGLGAGYDEDTAALAAEDQLPARQDSRAATWGENPEYDESDPSAEYDGDLDALTAEDQLPVRQDSRAASWGENPEYDESDLGAGYDGDLAALTAEDQLPTRQESRAATWGDNPGYYDETNLADEYDGDPDAVTAEDHTLNTGDDHALDSGKGDQDQTATGKPDDPPAEAPAVSAAVAPEHEDGNVTGGTGSSQPDASTEAPARHDKGEDRTPDPYEHQVAVHATDGTDVPVTVEHLPPEARTVGDTTPTGIGRTPTGEEFLDMESDDPSEGRFDRFIMEAAKEGRDVRDAFGDAAETLHDLRLPGPTSGGGHAHEGQPVPAQPAAPAFSDLVGSAALVGVAMLTGIRYARRRLGKGDGR